MSAPQGVAADSSQSSLSLAKQKLKQALTKQQQNPQSADGTTLATANSIQHWLLSVQDTASENTKLKVEIAQLKSLFIAHKDCEVTKMQITEGSLSSYPKVMSRGCFTSFDFSPSSQYPGSTLSLVLPHSLCRNIYLVDGVLFMERQLLTKHKILQYHCMLVASVTTICISK
ncbi:hypothetical protein EB796_009885 [Bugula neritina]|uniref:Uncharacterized protein n=1 Tax=Bugula neritina TaxID=10212 RepID=A0A7J7K0P3_BUGNE|nr:hypothetical protein EB796_009885 [Bugula neritina]